MKRFISILTVGLLLATGCSEDSETTALQSRPGDAVTVRFGMRARIETDYNVRPMAVLATTYTNWINKHYQAVVIRKIDSRWILDDIVDVSFPGDGSVIYPTGNDLPQNDFSLELRPGDYRIVVVINSSALSWNKSLKPGTLVADSSDAGFVTPPLATYKVSSHPFNSGYRQLSREIFVAVSDFAVPKQDDLHAQPMQPIELTAERRVGKFRLLLKNKVVNKIGFETTQHQAFMTLRSEGHPFVQGIDALGGSYYGTPEVYEMEWTFNLEGIFHSAAPNPDPNPYPYQIMQTNATVFSPYLLADPSVEKLDIEIALEHVSGSSGGYDYIVNGTFPRTLSTSRMFGIVLQPDGRTLGNTSQTLVGAVEAVNEKGVKEDAVSLFDPYFEWNALNDL